MRYVVLPNNTVIYEDGTVVMPKGDVGYDPDFSDEKFQQMIDDFGCQLTS